MRTLVILFAVVMTAVLGSHHEPRHHVSNAEVARWHSDFKFLKLFDRSLFDVCYSSFVDTCLPALNNDKQAYDAEFKPTREHCHKLLCNCTGRQEHAGCEPTESTICPVTEKCVNEHNRCIGRWLYDQQKLPIACSDFMHCTRTRPGIKAQFHDCDELRKQRFPNCDARGFCKYVRDPDGHHHQAPPTTTPGAVPTPTAKKGLPASFRVFIGCIVAAGIVLTLVGAMMVYSRVRHRHVVPAISQPLQVTVADPVTWYGLGQLAGASAHTCHVPRCTAPHDVQRFMMLPCRCTWCGCGRVPPSDIKAATLSASFVSDENVRSYPGVTQVPLMNTSRSTYQCLGCHHPVEAVVDLDSVYLVASDDAGPTGDEALCCVCFSEPVNVVALPCGHLATCSSCASRLCKPVPRRGNQHNQVDVTSQCPQCRAVTRAMVVLSDEQRETVVKTSQHPPATATCCQERPAYRVAADA